MNNGGNNGAYLPMKLCLAVGFTDCLIGCKVSWMLFL